MKNKPALILFFAGFVFHSCTYNKLDPKPCENSVPDIVSFSKNLIPLFNADCNSIGCHSGGSPAGHLNLTDSVAYNELMKPGKGYVDTITPGNSLLYIQINNGPLIMPPTGKLDDCTIEMVYKWIEQKAKNN